MRRGSRITWDQLRVGVTLLLGLTILAVSIFFIGQTGHVFGERYRLVTFMRSAAGLVPGAAVQLAGQSVGQVDEIALIPPDRRPPGGEAVAVWLAVNREVQEQIRADSRAQVRTQGLLGDRVIDISPGTAGEGVLMEGDTVPSAGSLDYDALLAEGATAVSELVDVLGNLSALTHGLLEGEGTVGKLVVDDAIYLRLVDLTSGLTAFLDLATDETNSFGRLLRDDEVYESIRRTLAGLDTLTASVESGEGTLGRLVRSDSLYRALAGVAARSDSLLASVQAGEGSAGRLFTDETMYEELLRMVVEMNGLLADLRADPQRFVPSVEVF
ncbi:MAG: MlaD family protein [Gemmatimonadota bacterium]